jgi:hypothetical protein
MSFSSRSFLSFLRMLAIYLPKYVVFLTNWVKYGGDSPFHRLVFVVVFFLLNGSRICSSIILPICWREKDELLYPKGNNP